MLHVCFHISCRVFGQPDRVRDLPDFIQDIGAVLDVHGWNGGWHYGSVGRDGVAGIGHDDNSGSCGVLALSQVLKQEPLRN